MKQKIQFYIISQKNTNEWISKISQNIQTLYQVDFFWDKFENLEMVLQQNPHIVFFDNINPKKITSKLINKIHNINAHTRTLFSCQNLNEKTQIKLYKKGIDFLFPAEYSSSFYKHKIINILRKYSNKYYKTYEYTFEDIYIDLINRIIKIDTKILNFTNKEFSLVSKLVIADKNTCLKTYLLKSIWGFIDDSTRVLPQYIHKINKKLETKFKIIIFEKHYYKLTKI